MEKLTTPDGMIVGPRQISPMVISVIGLKFANVIDNNWKYEKGRKHIILRYLLVYLYKENVRAIFVQNVDD